MNKFNARIEEEQATDDGKIIMQLVMVVKKVHTKRAQTCTAKKKCMKSMIMLNPNTSLFFVVEKMYDAYIEIHCIEAYTKGCTV